MVLFWLRFSVDVQSEGHFPCKLVPLVGVDVSQSWTDMDSESGCFC